MATTAPTALPTPAAFEPTTDAKTLRIDSLDMQCLADGLMKVSTTVGYSDRDYARMSDEDLFVIGEQAAKNLIEDVTALCEIRYRFKMAKGPLQGYTNWQDFCAKNFTCSIRTVQNRIAAVRGKDQSKVNVQPGNKHTRATIEVEHTVSQPVDVPASTFPTVSEPKPVVDDRKEDDDLKEENEQRRIRAFESGISTPSNMVRVEGKYFNEATGHFRKIVVQYEAACYTEDEAKSVLHKLQGMLRPPHPLEPPALQAILFEASV